MKIVKLYLKYQITLSNILILLFLVVFLSLSYFITIYDINESLSYEQVLNFYFENSLYYTKIVIIFISTFLFMKLKSERNEYLINIVITAGYQKKENYKGMIISNIITISFVISFLFMNFILIGYISKHYFTLKIDYIITYINLIILAAYYGLLTYLLIQITNNQTIYVIVIILFLLSDLVMNFNNDIKYVYLSVFPNINNINGVFYIKYYFIILYVICINKVNEIIYINNDLKG